MEYRFLNILNAPTAEILELLKRNVIGTPGHGMLYQHLKVENKIDNIENPYYVSLLRNNRIIGTCCFCSRTTLNATDPIHSFYIRYFSFKDAYRRKKAGQKGGSTTRSELRKELIHLLHGHGLDRKAGEEFFHYAYVDPRNIRSAMLCKEFGFETVRKFSTIIFNRINPKIDSRLTPVYAEEVNQVRDSLKAFYAGYTMFSYENLFGSRTYYVIKDDKGKILAGVQANPDQWKIHSLPGIKGKSILNAFSNLPYLNRIINKNYRFLTLEGIYYAPGNEGLLEVLFESLLAKYLVNSAMVWADTDSVLYKALKSLNLGIVSKLKKEVKADVICNFINFDEVDKKMYRANPAYISGIDLT